MRPAPWTRWLTALLILLALPSGAGALPCQEITNLVGFNELPNLPNPAPNCIGAFYCYQAILGSVEYELRPAGCDPAVGTCTVRATVHTEMPGNDGNPFIPGGSWVTIFWEDSQNNPAGVCGVAGASLIVDQGDAWIEAGGFSCTNPGPEADVYEMRVESCNVGSACPRFATIPIDLSPPKLQQLYCELPPKDDCDSCDSCPLPGAGGGIGGSPPRGLSPGGSGPGATLTYSGGGVGHPGFPGSAAWNGALGRYWSHDYAERIVEDPDETHVWLLTRTGVFREFSGLSGGVYTSVSPSDEYRTLHHLPKGEIWELHSPDGTVQTFDSAGRWVSTTDRNGNAVTGSYSGGLLTGVTFPDGRSEVFTYNGGRLASIQEVGVGGTPSREWTYTWSGLDLVAIGRPDGTAWEMEYADLDFPGYLTRLTLVGTDASERIEQAWEYDGEGNIFRTWKGAATFSDPAAVEKHSFTYDDPVSPTVTTMTGPLGNVTTYNLDRDPVSDKPRVLSVAGPCPSCGGAPERTMSYGDGANPLRPTQIVDGEGNVTLQTWGAFGQLTSRTEAFGVSGLERTTNWEYGNGSFPTFPTAVVQESVAGAPNERRTDMVYDADGNPTQVTVSGIEAGSFFSHTTTTTYNGAGQPLTIDPPGFGSTDVTTYTYDPARGDLLPLTRTDPLVGTTDFGYDGYNRRTATTDPNNVRSEAVYDDLDRVVSVTEGIVTLRLAQEGVSSVVTTYSYTPFGDLHRITLPEGNVVEHGYDGVGRPVILERKPSAGINGEREARTLDGAGQTTLVEQQRWNGSTWVTDSSTAFEFQATCRLARSIQAPGLPEEAVTEFAYDCNGNRVAAWDANHPSAGQTAPPSRTWAYDALDQVVSESVPWPAGGSAVTLYDYDVQGHLTSLTDPEGNVTSYVFSDRDLLTEQTSATAGTTTSTYDEHGLETSRTDARGVQVTLSYDAADRPTGRSYPDSSLDVTFAYGSTPNQFNVGRLTGISRHGETHAYAYDSLGRITQDGDLAFTYDDNGNRLQVSYPSALGVEAHYTYDFADRPETLAIRTSPGGPLMSLVTAAGYRAGGNLASLNLGTGDVENRSYDGRSVPRGLTVPGRLDWDLSTDGMGNLLAVSDLLDPTQDRSYTYLDYHYFLTQGNGPWGQRSWTYDKIGNRLTAVRDGVTDTYAYAGNGSGNSPRLSQVSLGGGGSIAYSYGAAGHMTQRQHNVAPSPWAVDFDYDDAGRLAALEVDGNPTNLMRYDGRDFLDYAEWQVYLRGPTGPNGFPMLEPTFDSRGTFYYALNVGGPGPGCNAGDYFLFHFAGRPLATWFKSACPSAPSLVEYQVTDHLGTPVLTFDETGTETWRGGLEPFGENWSYNPSPLRLPGQISNLVFAGGGASDLYYNVHRWYEYSTGRYTRTDPLGIVDGGPHLYAYALPNPLVATDPLGLVAKVCCRLLDSLFAGSIGRQRHCYVKADDGTVYGLYPEDRNGTTLGVPRTDDPKDKGGICKDCPCDDKGTSAQNQCLRDAHSGYPVGEYSIFGPNSNTYAGTLAKKCCKGGIPKGLGSAPAIGDKPPKPAPPPKKP